MTFKAAVDELLLGSKLTRKAWANDDCIFMHAGVLHLRKADGSLHTLIVSDGDMMADDWTIVREH